MGKRILVVDDSFGDRMIIRDYLASLGYHVVGEAKNTEELLEKYKKLTPDLVLLDASIPESDGVGAINKLLRQDHKANILVCAGVGQRALLMEALNAGARNFITKPINPRRLKKIIESTFAPTPFNT